jgi:tetratricopeptide (TPR) repeat protein
VFAETPARHDGAAAQVEWAYRQLDLGRASEAVAGFEAASALEGLAWSYFKLGKYDQAAQQADARQLLAPWDLEWSKARVTIIAAVPNRHTEAVAAAWDLVDVSPKDITLRMLLARTLIEVGRPTEAAVQLKVVLDIDPHNSDAFQALAELAHWDQDFETARELLQQALVAQPANQEILAKLRGIEVEAARVQAARLGPTLPLVFGLIGISVLLGYASSNIRLLTYIALASSIMLLTGLALSWIYLVPLS